jgi:DNA-binding transcriptional regulator YhcF (GntR family)
MGKGKLSFGTETFVKKGTGEEFEVPTVYQEATDSNFEKIWLAHILVSLNILGGKKIQILSYLFKNRIVSDNLIPKTLQEIADELRISYVTVSETIQLLAAAGLITRKRGIIYLSPGMIWKGTHDNRMRVMFEFRNIKAKQNKAEKQTPKQLQPAPAEVEMNAEPLEVGKKKAKTKVKKAGV